MADLNEDSNKKKNKAFLIKLLGTSTTRTDLTDKINTITNDNISILCSSDQTNPIYTDSYGTMYYHYVILRKMLYLDSYFIKNVLFTLAKIVHPNIQIFYGLMFDFIKEDNPDAYLILEYVNSINLTELSYLKQILSTREEILLKMQIIDRIVQTMAFLYHSGCPYLVLNGNTVKLNYNLLTDKHQHLKVIYCNNLYIGANLIKLSEIGTYSKYNKAYAKSNIFSLDMEDNYAISYHSPELIHYLNNDNESEEDLPEIKILEHWDAWSFGCIVYELFSGINPFIEIYDKAQLINTISKGEFNKLHEKEIKAIKNDLDNSAGDEIASLILKCTQKDANSRPSFHEIVQKVSEILVNFKKENFTEEEIKIISDKVTNMDFKYYHMPKFEELNLLDQQVKLSKELKKKMNESEIILHQLNNNH